jgi:hypothetical protein
MRSAMIWARGGLSAQLNPHRPRDVRELVVVLAVDPVRLLRPGTLVQLWEAPLPGAAERQIVDDDRLVAQVLNAERGLDDKA